MSNYPRFLIAGLLLSLLAASVGCQSPGLNPETTASSFSLGPTLPPKEENGSASAFGKQAGGREEGLLLRTGSILLGPGVGRNAWRWQGDGQWGF